MVSFRLSEEQYEQFLEACETSNARSVSEVARSAMEFWLKHDATVGKGELQHKLLSLEEQVAQLTAKVERYGWQPPCDPNKE